MFTLDHAQAFVNKDKHYGFVEFRTLEEATAGLLLDGIKYGSCMAHMRPTLYHALFNASLSISISLSLSLSLPPIF